MLNYERGLTFAEKNGYSAAKFGMGYDTRA